MALWPWPVRQVLQHGENRATLLCHICDLTWTYVGMNGDGLRPGALSRWTDVASPDWKTGAGEDSQLQ